VTEEVATAARRAAVAWNTLAETLEKQVAGQQQPTDDYYSVPPDGSIPRCLDRRPPSPDFTSR
jgi:hypothetical protein